MMAEMTTQVEEYAFGPVDLQYQLLNGWLCRRVKCIAVM